VTPALKSGSHVIRSRERSEPNSIDIIVSYATAGVRSMTLTTAAHLIAAAKARIENLSPAAVAGEVAGGEVLLVDIREAEERAQHGSIPGAIHTARGMLEFAADPTSAYYHPAFDPGARIILYCASGGRSALAADMLQLLGYTRMAHLDGGLKAWLAAGLPIERSGEPRAKTLEGGRAVES
jgi:rhodanese-related sulfurtransferase